MVFGRGWLKHGTHYMMCTIRVGWKGGSTADGLDVEHIWVRWKCYRWEGTRSGRNPVAACHILFDRPVILLTIDVNDNT